MTSNKHIVNFNKWCPKCKFRDCAEWDPDSPCHECLDYAINYDTDKPQLWEDRDENKH